MIRTCPSEDNILSCDFFEGELAVLRAGDVELHCAFIAEEAGTIEQSAASQSDDASASDMDTNLALIGPEWTVETIAGQPTRGEEKPTLSFMDAGEFAGFASCNRMTGRYEADGTTLSLGPIATTRMMCPDAAMEQEARLLSALAGVNAWSIDESGALTLSAAGGEIITAHAR